jgi:hypothetical protein
MAITIQMFPEAAIELHKEVSKHPALLSALSCLGPESTLNERIAIIAAYLGMVLDGYYVEEELEKLFEIILHKLRNKSAIILQ